MFKNFKSIFKLSQNMMDHTHRFVYKCSKPILHMTSSFVANDNTTESLLQLFLVSFHQCLFIMRLGSFLSTSYHRCPWQDKRPLFEVTDSTSSVTLRFDMLVSLNQASEEHFSCTQNQEDSTYTSLCTRTIKSISDFFDDIDAVMQLLPRVQNFIEMFAA